MFEHDGLEKDLIDTMRRLRCWPPAIRSVLPRVSFGPAGNRDMAELEPCCRRPEDDVIGIVGGQAGVTHGSGQPEPTKDLHRSGADLVAPHAWRLGGGARFDDGDSDAAF